MPQNLDSQFSIGWLEPQGINIVDLVGVLPEQYLKGATITYTPGFGILSYESGTRNGDTVTVTARASTRYIVDGSWKASMFSCLGQPPRIDQLGTVSPATTLRIYQGSRNVTGEVDLFSYLPAGKHQPIRNPKESEQQNQYRYWETQTTAPQRTPDGQLIIPANMGCEILMSGKNYRDLTLVFTAKVSKTINITVTGQESFQIHSYLGPGYRGHMDSLVNQLYGAGYGDRAEYYQLTVPEGSDYFFLNFPTMAGDAYTSFPGNPHDNLDRPTSGTYRVVMGTGLSVDHVVSMGLPLRGHWQDIDQADGVWLRHDPRAYQISAPEYFLGAGVPYDPCMKWGGCSRELLARVYTTPSVMKVVYLSVTRADRNLERLPVQMVGGHYHSAAAPATAAVTPLPVAGEDPPAARAAAVRDGDKRYRIIVPGVFRQVPPPPPDDPTGCSPEGGCGWFTPDGRMVDYIPSR